MVGKQGSDIVQLSTRNNLLIGVNQQGEEEDVRIEKHHEFKLSFVATLFFGTDYESIAPERLLVGQMPKTGEPSGPDPDGGDDATEESIAPERLLVGQMPKTGEPSGPDPDGGDDATE